MKYLLTSFLFFSALFLSAQASLSYRQGLDLLNDGKFEQAIEKFKTAVDQNPNYQDAWYYAGLTFNVIKNYQDAFYSFQRLENINPNYNPYFYFEAGKALIELDQFEKAISYFEKYQNRLPDNAKSTMKLHLAKNRIVYSRVSPIIRTVDVEMSPPRALTPVNSISDDYMPQVNPTGTRLYFTSVRKGGFDNPKDTLRNNFGEDVYYANLSNGSWTEPKLLPSPINSVGDDFGSSFTGDGQTMIYVRCGDDMGVGNCDLYYTQLNGTEWTEPRNMGNVVNSEEWDSQPSISSDGNRIIFTSARTGGYGGSDLYVTEKNHLGDWGIPQNLGSTVNTPLNENSPYLAPDGKTLYFASNGHPGYGGTDIFYSVFENGKWSKPINVGAPLNSKGDDTNFTISGQGIGYFASSRISDENYDIFQVELPDHLKPKPTVVILGKVTNSKTSAPLESVVLIEDINTGELIAVNKSNSSTGEYLVVLPAGRNYSVSANTKGFFFYSQSFEIPKDTSYQEITMDIALEPIEKGTKVVLNNIFFESGRAELKPISYVELNKAVELMKNNPTMVIEIGGHTDNVGSDQLNLNLSQERANAVKNYMVLAGVESNRIQSKGYGESQPIKDNTTEEGRAANRRTEFTIIDN